MGIEKGAEATKSFVKNHWAAFAVVAFAVVVLAFAYDHKNGGKLSAKIASLPLVGKLFT